LCEFRADRPGTTTPRVLAPLPSLAALEVGQHIGIGPTARALLRPAIVVAAMAAGISHHVDRGRSAQDLPAHRLDFAAVHVRLGLGAVAPVEHVVFVHLAHAEGMWMSGLRSRPPALISSTRAGPSSLGWLALTSQDEHHP